MTLTALVVEDVPRDADAIAACLRGLGFAVDKAEDGRTGLTAAVANLPDLVVLDGDLPGMDYQGWDVCRLLKRHQRAAVKRIRVLILTRVASPEQSFEAGADDYMVKGKVGKKELAELAARVKALMRRTAGPPYQESQGERSFSLSCNPGWPVDVSVGLVEFRNRTMDNLDLNLQALTLRGRAAHVNEWFLNTRTVGQELFERLFHRHREVSDPFTEARGKTGRVRLRFAGQRELLGVPLEFLYDANCDQGLYLAQRHPLTRAVWGVAHARAPLSPALFNSLWASAGGERLQVMLIAANTPPPIPAVDREVEAVAECLQRAFAAREIEVEVEILRSRQSTYNAVTAKLRRKPYHIIHYAGHSSFNERFPAKSGLHLHHTRLSPRPELSANQLHNLLRENPASLVYLSSCQGAETNPAANADSPVLGLADAIATAGVGATLALRWTVPDKVAAYLAVQFYQALAECGRPDDALLAVRQQTALEFDGEPHWLSPVLVS